jgi:hypothetical protein
MPDFTEPGDIAALVGLVDGLIAIATAALGSRNTMISPGPMSLALSLLLPTLLGSTIYFEMAVFTGYIGYRGYANAAWLVGQAFSQGRLQPTMLAAPGCGGLKRTLRRQPRYHGQRLEALLKPRMTHNGWLMEFVRQVHRMASAASPIDGSLAYSPSC